MIKGFDIPGAGSSHFPMDLFLSLIPHGVALKTFGGAWPWAFGDPTANINKACASGKLLEMEVAIYAARNGAPHVMCPEEILKHQCTHFNNVAAKWPAVRFLICHTNEAPNASPALLKALIRIIHEHAPLCTPVNNPMSGEIEPNSIPEIHGINGTVRPHGIISTDGDDAMTNNLAPYFTRNAAARVAYAWPEWANMGNDKDPPNARNTPPTKAQIETLIGKM